MWKDSKTSPLCSRVHGRKRKLGTRWHSLSERKEDVSLWKKTYCSARKRHKESFRPEDKAKMAFPVGKKVAALVALLNSLIAASQLSYLLFHIRNTFYYRSRRRLAQIFASSQQIQRIRKREGKERRFWIRPGRTRVWWDNFMHNVVVPQEALRVRYGESLCLGLGESLCVE